MIQRLVVLLCAAALAAEARVAELTAGPDGGLRPTVVPGEEPRPAAVTTRHRIVPREPDESTAGAEPGTRGAL